MITDTAHPIPPAMPRIEIISVPGLPLIQPGDDLGALIAGAIRGAGLELRTDDVITITSKIVSKAEGRYADLNDYQPSPRALEVAAFTGKDPRMVEAVLSESSEISRMGRNILVVRHRLGFISANAGIDQSNVAQHSEGHNGREETILLLPLDPDGSARRLREQIGKRLNLAPAPAVVITDTHGRPFRMGNVGVAVGVAGIPARLDLRGQPDLFARKLQHTEIALADELAAAADLLSGQAAEGLPVTIIRGVRLPSGAPDDGRAADLYRPTEMDLYRNDHNSP